ncbi:MAG TPA: hypothetical protein VK966_07310 [Longimicrobiales bacterium]|nr:hypothetical protein [Longimicrobiales bacterium]
MRLRAVWWRFGLLPAVVLLASAVTVEGQGAGSDATTVLRVTPGPRALALGGALVAVRDPFATEYNPASAPVSGVAVSYQGLPVGASAGAAASSFGLSGGVATVSLRFVDYGTVDVVEEAEGPVGRPTGGTATGGELTALAAYSLAWGPARLGVAGRWLSMEVAGLSDHALSADAGLLVALPGALAVGASVQNLGGTMEAGRESALPRTLRAGARASRRFGAVDALLAVEGRRRESRTALGLGLEVGTGGEDFRLEGRLGYGTRAAPGDAYSRFVFGGGVRVGPVSVDFGYRALGPLGSTRQLGLAYRF